MTYKKLTIAVLFSLASMTSANAATPQQDAIQAYEQAVKQNLDDANKWAEIGRALMSGVGGSAAKVDKAIAAYSKMLALSETHKDKKKMAEAYHYLGEIYVMLEDLDKALPFYQKALTLDESMGNKQGMFEDYTNLGSIYKEKGNKADAKRYWQQSLKYLRNPDDAKMVQTMLDELH